MAHRVNDDFCVGRLVEDEIWIWRRRDAPNGGMVGSSAIAPAARKFKQTVGNLTFHIAAQK
jgi:hypothetical protein